MSEGHAFLAPSAWDRWSVCAGAPALEEVEPDVSSADADFGTYAHAAAVEILRQWGLRTGEMPAAVYDPFPEDMRDGLALYVHAIRDRVAHYRQTGARVTLLLEQKLDISVITGEKDARGTGDAVIIAEFPDQDSSVLDVWDLKFGIGVKVAVVDNGQLEIYGLAAMITHGMFHNFSEINLVIHQPRVKKEPSEWQRTPDQLYAFGSKVTEAAALALSLRGDVSALSHLTPGEKQCRFCRVKWRCPELLKSVHREVFTDFQKLDDPRPVPVPVGDRVLKMAPKEKAAVLARAMSRVSLIESWCLSVRAACDDAMLNEHLPVPGFKVVQGRKGARRWRDPEVVIDALIAHGGIDSRLYMSAPELLSPTTLEKAFKALPKAWDVVQIFIEQSEGKASVASEDDPRPVFVEMSTGEFDSYDGSDLV